MVSISTLVDRVKIVVLSSGVGPFQLGQNVPAFRGVEALQDGGTYSYAVESGANYEAGTGVYVAAESLLVRTPHISSNGGAAVAFPANIQVNFTALAQDLEAIGGAFPIVDATGEDPAVAISQRAATNANAAKANATAIGVAGDAENMGDPVGDLLPPGGTAKQWFDTLEEEAQNAIAELGDLKAATGLLFKSKWQGTESALLALIDSDPSAANEYDDVVNFYAAWTLATSLGQPLIINSVVYINSAGSMTVDGKRVEITGHGVGTIVGGPDLDDRMIRAINSSSSGGTAARSVDAVVRGLRTNLEKAPQGSLNSVNHYNFSGFRRTIIDSNDVYSGAHYSTAGGDAGIFSTSNKVIISNNIFTGMVDLGVYQSGSADGTLDNTNAVFIANSYYNCANAWAAKRNYQYVRSVGEHFEGGYNGPAALAATGSGDGLLAGSRVSVVGPTFKNMANRCIDPRGSSDWNVSGMVVSGTFGKDYTGADVAGAAIFCVSGSVRVRGDFVADVVSTGSDHSAVRFQADGSTQSTDNAIVCTVSGIANGVIETGSSNRNRVTLDAASNVTNLFTLTGADSQVRWNRNGVRGFQIGAYDRLEGRAPFEASTRTTSTSLTLVSVGRVERFEPAGSNINAVLPSDATNGDRIIISKTAAAGAGIVLIRNPANTSTLARVLNPGTMVSMIWDGVLSAWVVETRSQHDSWSPFFEVAAASVPTPPAGAKNLFIDIADHLLKTKDSSGTVAAV